MEMWEETLLVLEHKLPSLFAGMVELYRTKYGGKVCYGVVYCLYLLCVPSVSTPVLTDQR